MIQVHVIIAIITLAVVFFLGILLALTDDDEQAHVKVGDDWITVSEYRKTECAYWRGRALEAEKELWGRR